MNEKIGIIGFGNMGQAIAEQLKTNYQICVFDKDKTKTAKLKNIEVALAVGGLVSKVDSLILAVKPQDLDGVLKEIKNHLQGKLVISIAAGISTKYLEKALGNARVIRVMPNIGVKIGESVTCLCQGTFVTSGDLAFAEEIFYYMGITKAIEEKMMNAATAICGSGPAYIFDFIETNSLDPDNMPEHARHDMMKRLEKAARGVGFSAEDAAFLAANTVNTSISLMHKTKMLAAELKKQVASKGGTTEKALEVLRKGGSWEEAAKAALERAEELSKGG